METALRIAGMALATFFTRYAMIAMVGREPSALFRRWLRYVPAALLAALIAPAALTSPGEVSIHARWAAMGVGALLAWRTRQVLPSLAGGLVTFWVLSIL
ncbi:MAG: AzlD domain-containing protein [Anaerolineae bacterium]|nr:AzlD domain-containing protein [Anaerolineae bacterium]MDH7473269.1 AzlD domain-containing protein [Anaerolineae bacterium]